jgi:hypothetical protein
MDEQLQLNISLTVAEVNVILRSLGKHPFEEIALLITKIKTQGESQIKASTEADTTAKVEE